MQDTIGSNVANGATTQKENPAMAKTPKAKKGSKAQTAKAATPSKVAAAPTERKSRRVFEPGQCHHRDAKGNPDCSEQIVAKRANLCPPHEREWQKAARVRYAANRAAREAADETPAPKRSSKKAAAATPEAAEELEEQLAASVARFATPELAAKARAKRQSQRSR